MRKHLMSRAMLLGLLLLAGASACRADGSITHLSGVVSVQKADGKSLPATVGTKVVAGDIVHTGAAGYVRIEMTDGGEMVMRPDSQLQVDNYNFVAAKPAEDAFVFRMLKGGLRTVTGLIGKRGNKDAYELKTQNATIGIRGTQFDLRVCQGNCGALADGTYLSVRLGAVQAYNGEGSLVVATGQVAHVPPRLPPVMLPRDPGIGFTPPPAVPRLDERRRLPAAPEATGTPAGNVGGTPGPTGGQGPVGGAGPAGSGPECSVL